MRSKRFQFALLLFLVGWAVGEIDRYLSWSMIEFGVLSIAHEERTLVSSGLRDKMTPIDGVEYQVGGPRRIGSAPRYHSALPGDGTWRDEFLDQ